jgi:hypothetical protein
MLFDLSDIEEGEEEGKECDYAYEVEDTYQGDDKSMVNRGIFGANEHFRGSSGRVGNELNSFAGVDDRNVDREIGSKDRDFTDSSDGSDIFSSSDSDDISASLISLETVLVLLMPVVDIEL